MTEPKKGKPYLVILLIFSGLGLLACKNGEGTNEKRQNSLNIFAASSLTDIVSDIGDSFEKNSGVTINYNFASSGTLARQIEQGARADIFISANRTWVDYLVSEKIIEDSQITAFARNQLVLIVPENSEYLENDLDRIDISMLLKNNRMAIGDPEHVPAGKYSLQAMKSLGWMEDVEGRLLKTKDVRTALMLVELSEAEAGLVYKTDALKSEKVKVLAVISSDLHEPVEYFMIDLKGNDISIRFQEYIRTPEVQLKLKSNGFKF